jgi:hypothetical protein
MVSIILWNKLLYRLKTKSRYHITFIHYFNNEINGECDLSHFKHSSNETIITCSMISFYFIGFSTPALPNHPGKSNRSFFYR